MHSISNLLKLNSISNEKSSIVDYESMSLSQLERERQKVKSLLNNKPLLANLKDQGAKLNAQLEKLDKLIVEKEANSNENKTELLVDSIMNKLESKLKLEQETKTVDEADKPSSTNYFEKKSGEKRVVNRNYDENRLAEAKIKVSQKLKSTHVIGKQTKVIPLDEAFKMLKEHERKVQEIQMKQAAEKLLQGKSVNYDYSFMTSRTEESSVKYREPKHDDFYDYEYFDSSSEDDDEAREEDDHFENYLIDAANIKDENEKPKSKAFDNDLNSID